MSDFEVKLEGLDEVERLFLRLSAFQSFIRKPMNAALGEAKRVMAGNVGSRKARAAVKVAVRATDIGMVGSVGPKGGKTRAGFLAAKFLETGTGTKGPKKKPVVPRSGKVMAIPTLAGSVVPSAQLFTAAGRLRKAKAAAATVAFAKSDAGMMPRPWFDRSVREAEGKVSSRFSQEIGKALHGD